MKTKSWKQIDAQFLRIQRALDRYIIDGNAAMVNSERWSIALNAWFIAKDNIAKLQNANKYLLPDKNKQYTRQQYMGY